MKLSKFMQFKEWGKSIIGDGLPDGPGGFPYAGLDVVSQWQENPLSAFVGFYREYGKIFTLRFMGVKQLFVVGPEANQKILVDEHEKFLWRPGLMGEALEPFLGKGLLTTDDEEHDRARKLMEPAFKKKRLKLYTETMIEETEKFLAQLDVGSEIEVYEWSRQLALSIASQILLGMDRNNSRVQQLSSAFEKGLATYNVPLHFQALQGPFTPRATRREARQEIRSLIMKEIRNRQSHDSYKENILSILMEVEEDGETFTEGEIADQLLTLLFAGHDTTISTVSWMLMLLGRHKEIYRSLKNHLQENINGTPTVDKIFDGLPYLDQILDETLRLYPAAWVGSRRTRESLEIYGHHVPAEMNVSYSSMVTHRMPELYEHPEMFDPSRFEPKRKRKIEPGAYVPFGRGPRTCIGMNFGKLEIKTIISCLMMNYDLELVPGQDFTPQWMPTLTPKNGVKIKLKDSNETYRSIQSDENLDKISSDQKSNESSCPVTDN